MGLMSTLTPDNNMKLGTELELNVLAGPGHEKLSGPKAASYLLEATATRSCAER